MQSRSEEQKALVGNWGLFDKQGKKKKKNRKEESRKKKRMQQLFGSGREVQRGNNRNEEQGLACWLLLCFLCLSWRLSFLDDEKPKFSASRGKFA